jgi:hypothetical protein
LIQFFATQKSDCIVRNKSDTREARAGVKKLQISEFVFTRSRVWRVCRGKDLSASGEARLCDRKGQAFMKTMRFVFLLTLLALASPLGAQMGMGPRIPDMSGIWHPVVGAGGAYEMADQGRKKTQLEMTIVGKEDVGGKPAFWMEMAMANPRSGGDVFMKYLVAPGDTGMTSTRMIMQMPGQDPMEMA